MKILFTALIVCLLAVPVSRAEEEKSENLDLAVQLVDAMDFCNMMEQSFAEMKATQMKQMKQMGAHMGADTVKDIERTFELIMEVMDCESMKIETAAIYADIFTSEELDGLIKFYKSDLGKSFSKKQPEMMRRSMEMSMKRMQGVMPMIMQKVQLEKQNAPRPEVQAPAAE